MSQIPIFSSLLPEAKILPFGEKAKHSTYGNFIT